MNQARVTERRREAATSFGDVAEQTVLQIFRDLNISATGRLLAKTVLDELNERIVVRRADLTTAIQNLVESGDLTVEEDGEENDWLLTLTASGYARSRALPKPAVNIAKLWPSMKGLAQLANAKRTATRRAAN